MEYGSEFDLRSNGPFLGGGAVPESWRLFRSGRDALKAFARLSGRKRVLLPALCCESMILPFEQNGCEVAFYRLKEDLSADTDDLRAKLSDGAVLLYMRYFGIETFSNDFLHELRQSGRDLLFLEDRTHDILVPRGDGDFQADAVAASLRKWAALPEGGMLETELGSVPAAAEPRYGELRCEAMEEKSRYLETGEEALRQNYTEKLRLADALLDESPIPVAMREKYAAMLRELNFEKILEARRRNLRRLMIRLAPMLERGTIHLMTDRPERSGLYLPLLIPNRDKVAQELYRRRLYCPKAIWPEPVQARGVCPVSHAVTENMLSVLCDQRYTEADMDFLAENLMEILEEYGHAH